MKASPNSQENRKILASRSKARSAAIEEVEYDAIAKFHGNSKELETALGMLRIGDHLGWRALLIMHNKRTIRKYEEILGIDVREFFPEEGPSAQRSMGYHFAQKLTNYWKAVSGDVPVENRGDISE